MKKLMINTLILGAMLLLAVSAHAFEFKVTNDTGQDTHYWVYQRAGSEPTLLADRDLKVDQLEVIDLEIKKPWVYLIIWIVKYETYFVDSWIAFWISEEDLSLEMRLVRGEFTPKEVIKMNKGMLL